MCSGALFAARARAEEPCATAPTTPKSSDPAKAYAEGRSYAERHRYADARGIYAWLLMREPKDREALLAFARVDAWDGCHARSEQRFRLVLAANQNDVEARAGLVDVLIWSGRLADALRETEAGLARDPKAGELWRRHATLLNWSGQRKRAIESADLALRYQPDDVASHELRDRLYVTQLRFATRADLYSRSYLPNIYTESLQLTHFLGRFELAADAQMIARVGGQEEVPATLSGIDHNGDIVPAVPDHLTGSPPIVDGLYSLSATYHMDGGYAVGAGPGFGAPWQAVPRWTAKAWFLAPIGTLFSTYFAYSLWLYDGQKYGATTGTQIATNLPPTEADFVSHKQAHIFAPALGYALTDEIQLEARAWASYLVLPRPKGDDNPSGSAKTSWVLAAGARAMWRIRPRLMLGAGYTYGPQLDKAPAKYDFLLLRSHIVTLFADFLVTPEFGLQPLLAFERRSDENDNNVALVYSAEIGAYLRW